jgi:hypothetical protein
MTPYEIQSAGLLAFVLSLGLNVLGIGLDFVLIQVGWPTVSDFARANGWATVLILSINLAGLVGLTLHLSIVPKH